ncbi:olfactory receptor 1-like [Rhinatrema bivittatum]|uniref:olfactory receptor 1-like n=1 Tax=Rhinatrema bivittatum TaxID=194408 RepID=UPI00112C49D1|nr:olfactory receptor 1-like [Rhinatrema bivittatum]
MLGNATIMALIIMDSQLHTPMYFFLNNLSLVDICFTSVTVPKMLQNMMSKSKSISFHGCIVQLYSLFCTGSMECFLLAVMAYDRYVAICKPLHYTLLMNKTSCLLLVAGCWVFTLLHSLLHIIMVMRLSFCGPNTIHHFFCDLPPLLKLSCSDTSINEILIFTEGSLVTMSPFVFIVASYVRIISTILQIHSSEGRYKAFSTCSSHLTVVALFFGTIFFTYFRPTSVNALEKESVVTVMYTVLTPLFNPFIYSLRNNEMKGALKRTFRIYNLRKE